MRAKVRWSRWRWSSLGFTLFLQLQGFSYWSAVALLHPWCATLTPEVRPVALNTWFDLKKLENTSFVLKKVFVVLALCVFDGRNYSLGDSWMDNACLQCTCLHPIGVGCCETWVLIHNSILLWRFLLAWKYSNKKRRKHWKHFFFLHYWLPRVHRPVDFPAWCQVWVEPVTCKVSLVQTADPRLPCFPGENIQDPSHGLPRLQRPIQG